MEYLIKDASKKLNISIYTLRYYDKEGLTPFVKKDENGVRKYTDEDLEWIRMLINLRDIDMPISNIREYIKKKVEDTISSLEMATEKLRNYDSAVADILDDTNLFENKKIYNK